MGSKNEQRTEQWAAEQASKDKDVDMDLERTETEEYEQPAHVVKKHKIYTLIFPIDLFAKKVLLGYKKRGFGVAKCMFNCASNSDS
jgi:hypothetical protein